MMQTLRLHDAVSNAVDHCATHGLRALLVDDVQFADQASIEWLMRWMEVPDSLGLRLAIAVRAGEMPDTLVQWIQAHVDNRLVEVQLRPLRSAAQGVLR